MSKFKIIPTFLVYLVLILFNVATVETGKKCNLSKKIKQEIASYQSTVSLIINKIVYGKYKGTTYNHLANLINKFGSRAVGSSNLEKAIDFMLKKSKELHLENVHAEKVLLPHWVRGKESVKLLTPMRQSLAMLGLGSSIGTPSKGIRAEAIVVNSFDELKKRANQVKGKIVVFNQQYVNYFETAKYRVFGASIASGYGAVATLIRSIAPISSLNLPHTGLQIYLNNVTKIPVACITIKDAMMLRKLQEKGKKLVIELKMEAKYLKPTTSRNFISEIVGKDHPEKIVVISGHLDSWDITKGAMDDGDGSILTWNALVILKALGLRPKRTIRAILWTAEEIGILGAFAYGKAHRNKAKNINFVMESDGGTFGPLGLRYSGLPEVGCILQEVLKLFASINTTNLAQPADTGPDLSIWLQMGIPGANLYSITDRYFWYHHTTADTIEVENARRLDIATALWAASAYVIADLSFDTKYCRTV